MPPIRRPVERAIESADSERASGWDDIYMAYREGKEFFLLKLRLRPIEKTL
jgi:hypothetical protein